MIRLLILLIIIGLGAGYYLGIFTMDDSANDIIEKSTEIAKEKAVDILEK